MTKTVYKNKNPEPTKKWVNVFVNKCGNCKEYVLAHDISICLKDNGKYGMPDVNFYCGDFKERK